MYPPNFFPCLGFATLCPQFGPLTYSCESFHRFFKRICNFASIRREPTITLFSDGTRHESRVTCPTCCSSNNPSVTIEGMNVSSLEHHPQWSIPPELQPRSCFIAK